MKFKFNVSFHYYTDRRCDTTVEAYDEIQALALAKVKLNMYELWCDTDGLYITIERV